MRDEREEEAKAKANGIIVTERADMRVAGVETARRNIPIRSDHPLDPDPWDRRPQIETPPAPGPDLPTLTPQPKPRRRLPIDEGWPGVPAREGRRDHR